MFGARSRLVMFGCRFSPESGPGWEGGSRATICRDCAAVIISPPIPPRRRCHDYAIPGGSCCLHNDCLLYTSMEVMYGSPYRYFVSISRIYVLHVEFVPYENFSLILQCVILIIFRENCIISIYKNYINIIYILITHKMCYIPTLFHSYTGNIIGFTLFGVKQSKTTHSCI